MAEGRATRNSQLIYSDYITRSRRNSYSPSRSRAAKTGGNQEIPTRGRVFSGRQV